MKITTKDILKLLPFEKKFKSDLLNSFDNLIPDQKFTIEQMLWDIYFALFKLKLEENLQVALLSAKEDQEKLDDGFYKRIREQTEKEMQNEAAKKIEEADLSIVRGKIESLLKNPNIN